MNFNTPEELKAAMHLNIDSYMQRARCEFERLLAQDLYYQHVMEQIQHYAKEKIRVEQELVEKLSMSHAVHDIHLYGNESDTCVKEKIHNEEDLFK